MDVVLALTLDWQDPRLTWDSYAWGKTRISELTVKPGEIWTPSIDIANRIHDYSPVSERIMMSTVSYEGKRSWLFTGCQYFKGYVRQYRLFRLHVNLETNNYLYPYDSQVPQIKLQSIDYGIDVVKITAKQLNKLNGLDASRVKVGKELLQMTRSRIEKVL